VFTLSRLHQDAKKERDIDEEGYIVIDPTSEYRFSQNQLKRISQIAAAVEEQERETRFQEMIRKVGLRPNKQTGAYTSVAGNPVSLWQARGLFDTSERYSARYPNQKHIFEPVRAAALLFDSPNR
jgi:hypothetical protein